MPEVLDQERMRQAQEYLKRTEGRPDLYGTIGQVRSGLQQNIAHTNTPTSAGRMQNPTSEIGRLLDELERLRQSTGSIGLDPNQGDIDLVRRIQEATLTPALAQISGGFGSRGLSGSSLEASKRAQMAGQVGIAGAQQLQDMTFQRAGFEMGRNKQLYESLIGAIGATTSRGAPGTQLQQKKKGGGIFGALGGILGGVAGSALGPIGTAIGSRLGSAIGGGGVTPSDPEPYRYPT